jgi:hypothetical protein
MTEDIGHPSQQCSVGVGMPAIIKDTSYAAHLYDPPREIRKIEPTSNRQTRYRALGVSAICAKCISETAIDAAAAMHGLVASPIGGPFIPAG